MLTQHCPQNNFVPVPSIRHPSGSAQVIDVFIVFFGTVIAENIF